ncbi:SURF1 family cytochrome oxidase biogenesis protein [Humibacter soli]
MKGPSTVPPTPASDAVARRTSELSRRTTAGGVAKPAAVYDTVTEGLTGWQFLRTGRWIGYFAIALAFALVCAGLALWQFDRGRGASIDNHLYAANFAAPAVPLTTALPTKSSYDPSQVWRRVTMSGTWDAGQQFYVRNAVRSGVTGFQVITPLKLDSGGTFLVNRGWVSATSDGTKPTRRPAPPSGSVDVVARLQPSQAKRGEGGVQNGQIESVDLQELAPVVGGDVYSGAWGVIVSPSSTSQGLSRVQASPPAEGVGYHYSYMIQWILFILIGFFLLWRAAVGEFRRINADDPEEQRKEAVRVQKAASKAFTDEETEDEAIDGYLPLTRWSSRPGGPLAAGAPARPALTGTPIPFGAAPDDDSSDAEPDDVYVLGEGTTPSPEALDQTGSGSVTPDESSAGDSEHRG